MKKLIIATRASALALWQAHYIENLILQKYPNLEIELNKITASGDKILDKPLALIGGKGHFTKEIEDEMLEGRAHLAVHSLKDVPTFIPKGLKLSAITKRGDNRDVFLSHKYENFEALPHGAVVGTTSLRRRMQIASLRPDLILKDLRGNVNTRLSKLERGEYDAIVLAYIGLERLDLLKTVKFAVAISKDILLPPMGQAALGIEILEGNPFLDEISSYLNDFDTFLCSKVERDFIEAIEGGCSAPIAANAQVMDEKIVLKVRIGMADGSQIMEESIEGEKIFDSTIGVELAKNMVEKGAKDLLQKAEANAFKELRPQRF